MRIPRRGDVRRHERELDAWFADLAEADGGQMSLF
jgi:hypothetical protein